jgi:hypothetical protein
VATDFVAPFLDWSVADYRAIGRVVDFPTVHHPTVFEAEMKQLVLIGVGLRFEKYQGSLTVRMGPYLV